MSYGLLYKSTSQLVDSLVGFCDSDFCGDLDKRRSLTGYCFTLYGNVISWKSSLQSLVALSTREIEIMALTEATKKALRLLSLAKELGVKQETVPIYSDSQSAIHLAKKQGFFELTKHIDVRLLFIRKVVASKKVRILKIPMEENPADVLTKSVTSIKFQKCMCLIVVSNLDQG